MKKFLVEFIKRGCAFCWCGPVILCIVWGCIKASGAIEALDVDTVILGIISSIVVAFVAAGISAIHQLEQLPRSMAALIHMAVLYVDYLVIYLINGWLATDAIGIFTIIFFAGFAVIWLIIYLSIRKSVKKLNSNLNK